MTYMIRTNRDRARRAAYALKAYHTYTGNGACAPEEDLTDLLCDLRHYADGKCLQFHECDNRGYSLYCQECDEQRRGGR